jgi:hypothetical protein
VGIREDNLAFLRKAQKELAATVVDKPSIGVMNENISKYFDYLRTTKKPFLSITEYY